MATTAVNFDNTPNVEFKKASKPVEAKEEKKTWTDEEVQQMAADTMKSFGWEGPMPKKEAKPGETPTEAISTPENEPKKEEAAPTEAPKETKKPAKAKPDPELDMADRIAAKISEENEKLLARLQPQKASQEPTKFHVEQKSEKETEDDHLRTVFSEMAKTNPSNAELPKKFESFLKMESAYQSEWEKENPGKDYDPASEDHEDWYEKNQPDYDERQFNRAQVQVEARKLFAASESKNQAKNALKMAVTIAESTIETVNEAMETDVKKHIEGILGENQVLDTDGPISEKFQSVNNALAEKITAANVLTTSGTGVAFDPTNPVHIAVGKEINEFNDDISKLSEVEQKQLVTTALGKKSRVLSKKFISMADYQKLSESDQAKHWCVATEPVLVAKLMAIKAKTEMTGWLDTLFNQVGRKPGKTVGQEAVPGAKQETDVPTASGAVKPSPPSLGPGASDVTQQPGAKSKGTNPWESMVSSF